MNAGAVRIPTQRSAADPLDRPRAGHRVGDPRCAGVGVREREERHAFGHRVLWLMINALAAAGTPFACPWW